MTDTNFSGMDADSVEITFKAQANGDGSKTPHKLEDPTQRAALLAALAPLATQATLAAVLAAVDGLEASATSILAKLSPDPSTGAGQAAILGAVDGLEASAASILAKLSSDPATQTTLEAVRALLAGTLTARPSTDQDPIFDHDNGVRVALTANTAADIITPPAGCKFIRISSEADTFIVTDNAASVSDNGRSIRLLANQPENIPVVAGVKVRGLSAAAAVVRATPFKVR